MRLLLIAGCAVLALAAPANADPHEEGRKCVGIADSLQRLMCFDQAFAGVEADIAQAGDDPEVQTTAWEIARSRSALDDSPRVVATLMSETSSRTGFGRSSVGLALRCAEDTTSVILAIDMFMMSDRVPVTIRIGDAPPETTQWNVSSNNQAVGLWTGSTAIPFLRRLSNGERLVVRVEDRQRVDATFNLSLVEEAVAEVANACNWAS